MKSEDMNIRDELERHIKDLTDEIHKPYPGSIVADFAKAKSIALAALVQLEINNK